jgi:Ca2+/Na+ antiporter
MARRTRREQPAHPGLVLLGILGVVGLTTAAVFGAAKLTARVEAIATIPGAMMPVLVATVAAVGVGVPLLIAALVMLARRRSSATLRLVLLAALATVVGGVLYAAVVLAVLLVLALFLPDPVVVLIAVAGTIAGLPFVGPVVFRLTTGRAPAEQPGGLVPPLPRRLREPRRRASLVSGRRARKDVPS